MQKIANVYDNHLHLTDVPNMSAASGKTDSQAIARQYARDWAMREIFLRKAKDQLSMARQKQIDAKVAAYKESLYIYEYEKSLIAQKFDTAIPVSEIDSFVRQFPGTFMLEDDIIRFSVIVNPPPSSISQLRKWMQAGNYEEVLDLCAEKVLDNYIEPLTWTSVSTLYSIFPDAPLHQMPANEIVYLSSNGNKYLVQVMDLKKKGTPAPDSYMRDEVRAALLQAKKTAFIEQIRKEMLEKAIENKKVKFYP